MPDADRLAAALDEIREREQAASSAPWKLEADQCDCAEPCGHDNYPYAIVTSSPHIERGQGDEHRDSDFRHSEICELSMGDAKFIVAARAAVPRLLAALGEVLKLHTRQETPVRCYDLDLQCDGHRQRHPLAVIPREMIRDCPDCTYRESHPCTHCREDDWPCPTVQAISRALLGEDGSDE